MHYCTKTMKVRKCGTASRTAFGKVALVAAALFTGYAQADTYAKLSGDTFAYYSDAECTQSIEAPATGLAGVTVLFADDAEYQALVPHANELTARLSSSKAMISTSTSRRARGGLHRATYWIPPGTLLEPPHHTMTGIGSISELLAGR